MTKRTAGSTRSIEKTDQKTQDQSKKTDQKHKINRKYKVKKLKDKYINLGDINSVKIQE